MNDMVLVMTYFLERVLMVVLLALLTLLWVGC